MPTKKLKQAGITYTKPIDLDIYVSPEEIIASARRYIGVPYRPQGRSRMGTDCGGLLLMIGKDTKLTDLEVLGYSQNPDGETFEALLKMTLVKLRNKEKVQPADIIACDYGRGIQHTAIVVEQTTSERVTVIHAKRNVGVTEQILHGYDRRAWVATYRLPQFKK